MKKAGKGLKILLFFLLVFVLAGIAAGITERKESRSKYQDFMELADQIDVLFLGSSHVLNGINPVQIYSEYGITSYNMGKPGGMVTESYWTLMNALDYCTPKCVVVDLWALDRDYKYLDIMNGYETEEETRNSVSLLHNNMDVWPLSKNKILAVNDLISDYETRKEFLVDFTLYHDRWSSLTKKDFVLPGAEVDSNYLLGAEQRTELYLDADLFQAEDTTQEIQGETVCMEYLEKILDVCEEKGIEVILTFLPMAGSYDQDRQAVNTAQRIADERGLVFLNMLPQETQTIIDYYTDMSDDTHLNANGMRKLSSYVGAVLKESGVLEDHRADETYAKWADEVTEWQTAQIKEAMEGSELYRELGALQNVNASFVLYMKSDSKGIHDALVRRFIKQITGTTVVDEALEANGPYLLIRDASGMSSDIPVVYEFAGDTQAEGMDTLLGSTSYIGQGEFGGLYVNGDYENNYLDMEEHFGDEVQILVLGQDGEVLSHLCYNADWARSNEEP